MLSIRRSEDRGRTKIDWLDSYHSFSFGEYYDPEHLNFGPLRVLNDDTILPTSGFPTHPHRDMEIVSIVTNGAMAHSDSTGSSGVIGINDIQRMTAGKGIMHSEFNASDNVTLKLIQIWFLPNQKGLTPSYEQITFEPEERKNNLLLVVSGNKKDGVVFINQDAKIFLSDLEKGNFVSHNTKSERGIYVHVAEGEIEINSKVLKYGDAAKITHEDKVKITSLADSKIILFDLTMDI
jgi:hypothetical protein